MVNYADVFLFATEDILAYPHSLLPWSQPGWFEEAAAWVRQAVTWLGIALTGPIEQPHVRPWSTVLRVPTDDGVLYMKATAPVLAHEPALTQALSRWRPDCMPEILAADLDRGWILMRDSGVSLRSLLGTEGQIRRWGEILTRYAELQIEMTAQRDDLLALGVLDRRLSVLPSKFERLLTDTDALCLDHEDGLSAVEYAQLKALVPRYAQMCEQLARYPIPETLHHDDFHDGNIFVRDGRYTFADWGESCVAHPFFTLVVTLRSVAYSLDLLAGDPVLDQLRDAYLKPWEQFTSWADLQSAFVLANRVGMVNRALTWHRVVSHLEEPYRSEQADAVPGWLHEFLTEVSGD
jgi:hypothetical protein